MKRGREPTLRRHKRCAVCLQPATHVEVEDEPRVTISRKGLVVKQMVERPVYYCPVHSGDWRIE